MNPECTVVAVIRGRPEKRAELREVLRGMVAPTRREPGCVAYHLHVSEDDPDTFMFYESWRTRADWKTHLALPHLVPLLSRTEELLSGPIQARTYVVLGDGPG